MFYIPETVKTSTLVQNGGSRMEEEATVSVLLCSFCDFHCYKDRSLLKHIHGNDPNFVVYFSKCERSYTKWSSLKKHLHREHPSMLFEVFTHDHGLCVYVCRDLRLVC